MVNKLRMLITSIGIVIACNSYITNAMQQKYVNDNKITLQTDYNNLEQKIGNKLNEFFTYWNNDNSGLKLFIDNNKNVLDEQNKDTEFANELYISINSLQKFTNEKLGYSINQYTTFKKFSLLVNYILNSLELANNQINNSYKQYIKLLSEIRKHLFSYKEQKNIYDLNISYDELNAIGNIFNELNKLFSIVNGKRAHDELHIAIYDLYNFYKEFKKDQEFTNDQKFLNKQNLQELSKKCTKFLEAYKSTGGSFTKEEQKATITSAKLITEYYVPYIMDIKYDFNISYSTFNNAYKLAANIFTLNDSLNEEYNYNLLQNKYLHKDLQDIMKNVINFLPEMRSKKNSKFDKQNLSKFLNLINNAVSMLESANEATNKSYEKYMGLLNEINKLLKKQQDLKENEIKNQQNKYNDCVMKIMEQLDNFFYDWDNDNPGMFISFYNEDDLLDKQKKYDELLNPLYECIADLKEFKKNIGSHYIYFHDDLLLLIEYSLKQFEDVNKQTDGIYEKYIDTLKQISNSLNKTKSITQDSYIHEIINILLMLEFKPLKVIITKKSNKNLLNKYNIMKRLIDFKESIPNIIKNKDDFTKFNKEHLCKLLKLVEGAINAFKGENINKKITNLLNKLLVIIYQNITTIRDPLNDSMIFFNDVD